MSQTFFTTSSPIPTSPKDEEHLNFERKEMEPWYDPSQLARTAIRTLVSGLFGTYADKREMQACLKTAIPYEDLAHEHEVWVDYISDLGSGFNPTYSLAYLLGAEKLHVAGHDTKRGHVLIMGGDQVYPTPSSDQYTNRLTGPYRAAKSYIPEEEAPRLFAIPGNHDWYDGLTSFLKVFCQERWIGGWKTKQSRSYFAIKLPHNWWIWGIDIQLSDDIDQPQQTFFEQVNRNYTEAGDKVILCTAEPAWVYQAYKDRDKSFRNLEWFCEKYITNPNVHAPGTHPDDKPMKQLSVPLTLTGDLHHYSSYFSPPVDLDNPNRPPDEWKITAGGGGAFMHPTHHLPVNFSESEDLLDGQRKPKEYQSSSFFPDQAKSRLLVLGNLLFPFKNPWFTSLMGSLCLLFTWMMLSAGDFSPLERYVFTWACISDVAKFYAIRIAVHPFLFLFIVLVGTGFVLFADTSHKKYHFLSYVGGALHAIVQLILLLTVCWAFYKVYPIYLGWQPFLLQLLQAAELFIVGGLAGGLTMGLYLLVANGVFNIHETEAFSALRIQDYKNFLRLHITKEKLTIYPIKVKQVARKWEYQANMTGGEPWFEPAAEIHVGLIEPPIEIKN